MVGEHLDSRSIYQGIRRRRATVGGSRSLRLLTVRSGTRLHTASALCHPGNTDMRSSSMLSSPFCVSNIRPRCLSRIYWQVQRHSTVAVKEKYHTRYQSHIRKGTPPCCCTNPEAWRQDCVATRLVDQRVSTHQLPGTHGVVYGASRYERRSIEQLEDAHGTLSLDETQFSIAHTADAIADDIFICGRQPDRQSGGTGD